MPTTGQLFFGTEGGGDDTRIAYVNQGTTTQLPVADNAPTLDLIGFNIADIVLDTAAGFYFAIVNGGNDGSGAYLVRGSLSGGPVTILADYRNVVGDPSDDTLVNALAIDPVTNRLYVGLQEATGSVPGSSGIRRYTYNTTTGAVTDNGFLVTATSSAKPLEGGFNIFDPRDFDIDTSNGTLVFTELLTGGVQANGIFRLNLSSPNTIVQLVSQTQFPDNGSNGFIADIEVDNTTNLAYFSTFSQSPSPGAGFNAAQNRIWFISDTATAGTATQLALFATDGTTNFYTLNAIFYPGDMIFDQSTRQLYIESEQTDPGADDLIYVFQLNAAGTSATLVNTITPTLAGTSANIQGMAFNILPVISSLTGTGTAALEQSAAIVLTTNAPTFADADGARLSSATVQVTGGTFTSTQAGVNNDNLAVGAGLQISGLVAGTNISLSYNAATRTLTLTGQDTLANYQTVFAAVRYFSVGDNPTNYGANTTRTLTWTISDGALNVLAASPNSATTTINVTAINDAPVFTLLAGDSATTTETAGTGSTVPTIKIDVGGNATVADLDALNFSGGTIRFAITAGAVAAQDQLNIDTAAATTVTVAAGNVSVGGTVIGTVTGGGAGGADLLVTLNASATPARVQSLIRAVDFTNTGGDNPTAGARTVTVTLNDGGGTANGGANQVVATITLTVAAVDDAPTAVADIATTIETTIAGISVLGNDTDPDGGTINPVSINGSAIAVGATAAIGSGATVTRNADGTLTYNPNGAFNALISATTATATGASNSSAVDSFIYALNGGSSTTVSVTVNGVDGVGDQLRGTPGIDTINGTGNADTIFGLADNDVIFGNGGGDTIDAGDGDDRISGGLGDDTILGGLGRDLIGGGDGNDILDGGTGIANEMLGNAGDDFYRVRVIGDSVIEASGEGTDTVEAFVGNVTLGANLENLTFLGAGNFIGQGNALDNVITGGTGADSISGFGGNDRIIGGSGAANELVGGQGNDTYVISVAGDSIVEAFGEGTDTEETALAALSLANNVENLTYTGAGSFAGTGNGLANALTGGAARDSLSGLVGDDTLDGGSGVANELVGGQGNDTYIVRVAGDSVVEALGEGTDTVQTALGSFTLAANVENLVFTGASSAAGVGNVSDNAMTGTAAADTLSGLGGNDTLIGGGGADLLIGGTGADIFRYLGGETGLDRIIDFASGSDRLSLSSAGFTQTGVLTFQSGAGVTATTANSTFLYDTNTGIVSYDADGNGAGAAVQIAQLNTGLVLGIGDFIIV
jgi:Ca2+-binding RTX toxin-like protein